MSIVHFDLIMVTPGTPQSRMKPQSVFHCHPRTEIGVVSDVRCYLPKSGRRDWLAVEHYVA